MPTTADRLSALTRRIPCIVLMSFLLWLGIAPFALYADDSESSAAEAKSAEELEGDADESLQKKENHKKAAAGMMVLVGIALAGVGLLLIIILWGNRLRRISRRPLPSAERGDELFYLKHPHAGSPLVDDDDFELDTRPEQS